MILGRTATWSVSAILCVTLYVSPSVGEVLKYTDSAGGTHFVSRLEDIPESYRDAARTLDGAPISKQGVPGVPSVKGRMPLDTLAWFSAEAFQKQAKSGYLEWIDKQKGFHAIQPNLEFQPSLATLGPGRGKPVVKFDGVDDYLTSDAIAASLISIDQLTVIVVAASEADRDQIVWSIHRGDKTTDVARFGFAEGSKVRVKCTEKVGKDYYDQVINGTEHLSVYSVTFDRERAVAYKNGQQILDHQLPRPIDFSQARYFSIGQEYDKGKPTDFLSGSVAELLMVTRVLSDQERGALERQLMDRYGIAE